MKFSKRFERDFAWYSKFKDIFNFDGGVATYTNNKGEQIIKASETGFTAKECFYAFDSQVKILECREPELLQEILRTKGSINLNIQMWAESRAQAYLSMIEFEELIKEFSLLDWMIEAVERQKMKFWDKVFKKNTKGELIFIS